MSGESGPKKPGIIPTILSPHCDKHIEWIKNAFRAEQREIYRTKDEKNVMHCSLTINGGYIYLCDRSTSMEKKGLEEDEEKEPGGGGGGGVLLHLELQDPNTFWTSALNNGASVVEDLRQQYWGALYGSLRDPFGFVWGLMKGGDCRKPGVIPYLILEEGQCEDQLEWLTDAFGGVVKDRFSSPDGKLVQHSSVEINGGCVYLADDAKMAGQQQQKEEEKVGGGRRSNVVCHMDLPDPRAAWDKITRQKGCRSVVDLKVQFWGDLYGTLEDRMGFQWSMCEEKSPQTTPSSSSSSSTTSGGRGKVGGVISYVVSPDCDKHIKWIEGVLDGEVKQMTRTENGEKVMHCLMSVNSGSMMISDRIDLPGDARENWTDVPRDQRGFVLHLNVPDPDLVWRKAMENGGVQIVELKKQFWGDYYGMFQDPFGYQWSILKC